MNNDKDECAPGYQDPGSPGTGESPLPAFNPPQESSDPNPRDLANWRF